MRHCWLVMSVQSRYIFFDFGNDFFLLDSSVLKPNGDLSFGEVGGCRYPSSFFLGYEFVGGIFSLEFFKLRFRIGNPFLPPSPVNVYICLIVHHIS